MLSSLAVDNTSDITESSDDAAKSIQDILQLLSTLTVLGGIILATVVGNAFVIAAVVLERNLRTHVANYLVASLAVADLMVAALVMPVAAVKDVSSRWILGRVVCDAWISIDVICCTASILHLVAISIDRYWAVTRLDYIHNRSKPRILAMIAISWIASIVISLPPLFLQNNSIQHIDECIISQDLGYTVFSTLFAFYLPFLVMMIIYIKVYRAAQNRIRRKHFKPVLNRSPTEASGDAVLRVAVVNGIVPEVGIVKTRGGGEKIFESLVDHSRMYVDFTKQKPRAELQRTLVETGDGSGGARQCNDVTPVAFVNACHGTAATNVGCDMLHDGTMSNDSITYHQVKVATEIQEMTPRGNVQEHLLALPLNSNADIKGRVTTDMSTYGHLTASCHNASEVTACKRHSLTILHLKHSADDFMADSASNCVKAKISTTTRRSRSFLEATRQLLGSTSSTPPHDSPLQRPTSQGRSREQTELRRERKAARTLAIITGTFILCWLPFFVIAILRPFCGENCSFPYVMVSLIGWLGYVNSLLNPVIYTVFNPDFRSAFRRILFGKYSSRTRRRWFNSRRRGN